MEDYKKNMELWEKQRQLSVQKPNALTQETINQITKIATQTSNGPLTISSSTYDNVCPICLGVYKNPVSGQCGHLLCESCWSKTDKKQCPVCKQSYGEVRKIYGLNLVEEEEAVEQIKKTHQDKLQTLQKRLQLAKQVFNETDSQVNIFQQVQEQYAKTRTVLQQKLTKVQMELDTLEVDYAGMKNKILATSEKKTIVQDLIVSLQNEIKKLEMTK
ncbi:C3HC4 type (RING finger) domain-containing protein [Hexamita inflata]|uniref:C3HC4 type (RING finger) domain-containing protein n=1 Tax=Hexamita inflata TaxID=28002 RepID=A0AA86NIN3_9EUKA|nr:C3HC4 type (RING finger) domain-containing protein [Hexamita inflata]